MSDVPIAAEILCMFSRSITCGCYHRDELFGAEPEIVIQDLILCIPIAETGVDKANVMADGITQCATNGKGAAHASAVQCLQNHQPGKAGFTGLYGLSIESI